jgi:hypothetical protein
MGRTGSEPRQARSPLRLRLTLAILGFVWATAAAVGFALASQPGWAGICAAIAAIAVVDTAVVVHRIHQGAHYQPGRDVPPYRPVEPPRKQHSSRR